MSSRYTIPGEIIYHSCKRVSGAAIRGLFAPSRPIVCFQFIKNSKKVRITIATAVRIGVNRPYEMVRFPRMTRVGAEESGERTEIQQGKRPLRTSPDIPAPAFFRAGSA